MTGTQDSGEKVLAALEQEFMQSATPITTPSGRAWRGFVSLYTFAKAQCAGSEYPEDDAWELVDSLIWGNSDTLIYLAVRNPGPPDWDWSLRALQIGDRGFIWQHHEVCQDDNGLPMFAAWEPYDDQRAFEAAFIAGYSDNMWNFIGLGTHYSLGLVSSDVWERALRVALRDNDNWSALNTGPTDTPEQREEALRRYLLEREGV